MMSYWTFSDVFEEQGVVKTPFYGGFGLLAEDGIPKPAFNAFKLLHRLGERRISISSDSALLTRKKDGSLVIAVWNYAPPEHAGAAKTVTLHFQGGRYKRALVSTVDPDHGDVHSVYEKMGSPRYLSQAQIQQLKQAAELPPAAAHDLKGGELTLTLASYELAVVEVR
jgi:xylan 1,4-beta-xylosidase